MSLFNWFSGKPGHAKATGDSSPVPGRDKSPVAMPQRLAADAVNRSEERKVKRHARREQLYVAIREAMTYSGVLSASYKFKVLSLDQRGDQFLVMVDVDQTVDGRPEHLAMIEAKIVQTAKARFEMLVTSVYWRIDTHSASARGKNSHHEPIVVPQASEHVAPPVKKPAPRYDPIQDEEVAAFKQALAAASASSPSSTDSSGKIRSGPRSYTLLTGFEDTEMPESYAAPVLSNTQYGDLN